MAPLLSLTMLHTYQKLGWLGSVASAAIGTSASTNSLAIFSFIILLEGCMPPSQNTVIMLQLDELPERAARMAKLLTTIYVISILPVTIALSFCLAQSGIMKFY